jgi:hypothetical protein
MFEIASNYLTRCSSCSANFHMFRYSRKLKNGNVQTFYRDCKTKKPCRKFKCNKCLNIQIDKIDRRPGGRRFNQSRATSKDPRVIKAFHAEKEVKTLLESVGFICEQTKLVGPDLVASYLCEKVTIEVKSVCNGLRNNLYIGCVRPNRINDDLLCIYKDGTYLFFDLKEWIGQKYGNTLISVSKYFGIIHKRHKIENKVFLHHVIFNKGDDLKEFKSSLLGFICVVRSRKSNPQPCE